MLKRMIVIGCLLSLMGCEFIHDQRKVYVRDRGKDYMESELIAPLQVPEYLTQYHSDVFPLPDYVPNGEGLENVSLKPPGFGQSL